MPASGHGPELWDSFFTYLCGMAIACTAVTAAARCVLPVAVPHGWGQMRSMKPWHMWPLSKAVAEWLPVFVVPTIVWRDMLDLSAVAMATPAESMLLPATPAIWQATGSLLGYMAFDCVFMFLFAADVKKSGGASMYYQLWGHHVISLIVWPLGLRTNMAVLPISWFLFSEASNLFLTLRTVLKKLQHDQGSAYAACGLAWLISFFLTRMVPLPLLAMVLLRGDISDQWIGYKLTTYFTVPLPLLLNTFWFYLGMRGLLKFLLTTPGKDD